MATVQQVKQHLAAFAFRKLFIEVLGWDLPKQDLAVDVHGRRYDLINLASKAGHGIYLCTREAIPPKAERIAIDRALTKLHAGHLIAFTDSAKTEQIWLYTPRVRGADRVLRTRYVEHPFNPGEKGEKGQTGEPLAQLLLNLEVTFAEEDALTGTDVLAKLDALDVERVTKRFYTAFQAKHTQLAAQISGMDDAGPEQRDWYASLILNRLMFSYFIQKKGFLDGDHHYLRHHLETPADSVSSNHFYRSFLLRFFHDGLGGRIAERSTTVRALLGKVPYLNGGLFEEHQIERDHRDSLDIPDAAFATIFDFFEGYQWHLDTTGTHQDNEINPDVLGYIFEKYINQKQMGAYYTKEDITEYISKNTIIPFLFDRAREGCQTAFDANGPVWSLLRNDPDRYIHEAVRRGATVALPPEIAVGIHDVSQRTLWNQAAPPRKDDTDFALPTETWRELVARRQRYEEIKGRLSTGEVTQINDLITYNLDIILFARDVIQSYEGVDLIKAFYKAITAITVLDPTCGSGAFLFAALNILEPLYEACLDAMQNFVLADDARLEAEGGRQRYEETFRVWLEEASEHKNRRYFIYKSIIIRNLFGVDIMEEAVEIAKLRLFLKLVAQTDTISTLEPLPDIDFNIRAGNTLVGYARRDDIAAAVGLDMEGVMVRIDEKAEQLSRALDIFRDQQMILGGKVTHDDKKKLHARMAELNDALDRYLAGQYGIEPSDVTAFASWRESHKPFHWYAQFFRTMHDKSATKQGGFDVIIGNPPYVEWSSIKDYSINMAQYHSKSCGNVYTVICERSYDLLSDCGKVGMIVPISCVSTERMQPLRNTWHKNNISSYISHYSGDAHPSVLFQGVKFRLSILIQYRNLSSNKPVIYTTHFQKWTPEGRNSLFALINYTCTHPSIIRLGLTPKLSYAYHIGILEKLVNNKHVLEEYTHKTGTYFVYSHRIVAHFVKSFVFIPFFKNERDGDKKSEDYKVFALNNEYEQKGLAVLLSSSLFYAWFVTYSDVYHCGREIITNFPIDLSAFSNKYSKQIDSILVKLMSDLKKHSVRRQVPYKSTGMVEYDEFYPRLSKPIIDEIDRVLAEHYGFTAEELDFIINYDIKYRMGREAESDAEEI